MCSFKVDPTLYGSVDQLGSLVGTNYAKPMRKMSSEFVNRELLDYLGANIDD